VAKVNKITQISLMNWYCQCTECDCGDCNCWNCV